MTTSPPKDALFSHQKDLPSLPVPALDDTLSKFIQSVKPFLNDEEFEHTTAVVEDFKVGVGARLQKMLEERGESERNWLEEWWEYFAYLQPRYPTAININWQGVMPGTWGSLSVSQAEAAAMFTRHVLKFREGIVRETMEPEVLAGQKLCMNQYTRMFNSCRVPGEAADEIVVFPPTMRHIVVLHNSAVYSFDVLDASDNPLPFSDIVTQFERVLSHASVILSTPHDQPVSVLTSERRDAWARARDHMRALDPCNADSLRVIESALFVVALEAGGTHDLEQLARACLHGNGRNKWFDKPFTLIIFDNGRVGTNGEHTWADAMVVVRMFYDVIKSINAEISTTGFPRKGAAVSTQPEPTKLKWKLDSVVSEAIETASCHMQTLTETVDLRVLDFPHYGKGFMKRYRIVPDFYVQMAIQLAFYRLHSEITATYETGHTRLFYHGRTDTIKACTVDSVAFVKAMCDSTSTDSERFEKLKAAVATHSTLARDALAGKGVDRHLMGLNILSEMSGIKPRPALFTDKGYLVGKKYRLSTSNISMGDSPIFGGFMAMYDDGYGVCYGLMDGSMKFSITSVATCRTTSARVMKDALELALVDMQRICLGRNVVQVGASKL